MRKMIVDIKESHNATIVKDLGIWLGIAGSRIMRKNQWHKWSWKKICYRNLGDNVHHREKCLKEFIVGDNVHQYNYEDD